MSNGTDYVRVSREFVEAKRAYEISASRIVRGLIARGERQANPPPRRPVGSPSGYRIPPPPPGRRSQTTVGPNITDMFDRIAFQLHINSFAHYMEALRAYYGTHPQGIPSAIRKAYDLATAAQQLGRKGADSDLQLFAKTLIEERCQTVMAEHTRTQTREARLQMVLTLKEAQQMSATDMPGCKALAQEIQRLQDAGKLN